MFLTKFDINAARRGARSLLASPQKMHAAVCAAFPPAQPEQPAEGRILWRVDQYEHQHALYVVSPSRPDLTHLVEAAGWPTIHGWETREYTPLLDRLSAGDRWAFRVTVNPVRGRRKDENAKHSQRYAHVTVAQQTNWLLERTERSGFAIAVGADETPGVLLTRRQTLRFRRRDMDVTLSTAVFEGALTITDPRLLRRALVQGIGPAKGYGCGLLTLAPERTRVG